MVQMRKNGKSLIVIINDVAHNSIVPGSSSHSRGVNGIHL